MTRQQEMQSGFTIVEVMVAIAVLLVGVLGTVTLLTTASATTETTQAGVGATALGREVLESVRTLAYDDVTPSKTSANNPDTSLTTNVQNLRPNSGFSSLQDANTSTASTWEIARRGVTYIVTLSACVVDDPKDGTAATHTPVGFYCAGLTNGSGDSNPDDYRRVTVNVSWTRGSRTRSISQTALIANPSGVLGPPNDFQGTLPPRVPGNGCVSGNPGTLTYNPIVTPSSATKVTWSVNDPAGSNGLATDVTPSPNPSPGSKQWQVQWDLGSIYDSSATRPANKDGDATYIITLTAYSPTSVGSGSIPGPPSFISQPVNCAPPNPPTNYAAGYNWRRCVAAGVPTYPVTCAAGTRIIDFQWAPSPDNDIMGYRVFRVVGAPDYLGTAGDPADAMVCPVPASPAKPLNDPSTVLSAAQFLERGIPTCKQDDPPLAATTITAALYASLPNALAGVTVSVTGDHADYYVQAVDPDPTDLSATTPRPSPPPGSQANVALTENVVNVAPTIPTGVDAAVVSGTNAVCVYWGNGVDVNALGLAVPDIPGLTSPIRFYRVYRDGSLLYSQRLARSAGGPTTCTDEATRPNEFIDTAVPSGSHTYTVTAVDSDFLESFVVATLSHTVTVP